jgi:hypothetical protein
LAGANVRLELVAITPGLHVGTSANPFAMTQAGDSVVLGGANLEFDPIFWTAGLDPINTPYSASFQLFDDNGVYGQSGTFTFEFESTAVIPEPGSGVLATGGVALFLVGAGHQRCRCCLHPPGKLQQPTLGHRICHPSRQLRSSS